MREIQHLVNVLKWAFICKKGRKKRVMQLGRSVSEVNTLM